MLYFHEKIYLDKKIIHGETKKQISIPETVQIEIIFAIGGFSVGRLDYNGA